MNYLAHLYLAGDDPVSLIGNLMGDFVKGPVPNGLEPALRQGIRRHRKIDVFTDAHVIVKDSKQRLQPRFRRYGGILVDIFYDHFLAQHWTQYSSEPLREFSLRAYGILTAHYAGLPLSMQASVSHMIANDLLMSYRDLAGIRRALRGIEGRLKRESRLQEAINDLKHNYAELAEDFATFFPELIAYARGME